jgi:hypothetical protein
VSESIQVHRAHRRLRSFNDKAQQRGLRQPARRALVSSESPCEHPLQPLARVVGWGGGRERDGEKAHPNPAKNAAYSFRMEDEWEGVATRCWQISHTDAGRFVTWVEAGSLGLDLYAALILGPAPLPSCPEVVPAVWRGFVRSVERSVHGLHGLGKLPASQAGTVLGECRGCA